MVNDFEEQDSLSDPAAVRPRARSRKAVTETEHTCVSKGAFGILDPSCPRCQEIAVEKAVAGDTTATVTIQRALRPDLPQGTVPVRASEQQYQAGAVKKMVERDENDVTTVTYTFQGKTYHGCLSFQQERRNPQGQYLGTETLYVLYPTVEERDAAREAQEEQRRRQEEMRMEIRRAQSREYSDLIGPNGLPANPAAPAGIYGGVMPPVRGLQ